MFSLRWRNLPAGLLAAYWAVAFGFACQAQTGDFGDRNLQIERAVEKALARTGSFDFHELPLRDAVRSIGRSCGVNFLLDHKALEEAGIAEDVEVSIIVEDNTADAALAAMLRQLELAWIVENGQPMVTTCAHAETVLDTRVYPVRDLVIARDEKGTFADFESLIDVVTSSVAPTTWAEVGGMGSIKPFFNSQAIVVAQTREVHRQVEVLLAELRSARDAQGIGHPYSSVQTPDLPYPPSEVSASPADPMSATSQPASGSPLSRLVRIYE